jgi:uncharacterized protein with GYD domain
VARYLFRVSYSVEGLKGVLHEGAASRRDFIASVAANLGGSLESFDFAFGDTDLYAICEIPSDEMAAAIGLAVGASGVGSISTVKLLTPEQVDAAREVTTGYRPPGA